MTMMTWLFCVRKWNLMKAFLMANFIRMLATWILPWKASAWWEAEADFSTQGPGNDAKRVVPVIISSGGSMRPEVVGRALLKPSSVAQLRQEGCLWPMHCRSNQGKQRKPIKAILNWYKNSWVSAGTFGKDIDTIYNYRTKHFSNCKHMQSRNWTGQRTALFVAGQSPVLGQSPVYCPVYRSQVLDIMRPHINPQLMWTSSEAIMEHPGPQTL